MLVFWKNLFELNPALRPILPESAADQDRFLIRLLDAEAAALGGGRPAPPAELPATNGAMPGSVVGEALLWTLQEAFGADFTPQVCSAWETLYRFVTGTAKAAPAQPARGRHRSPELVAV
jgi:hypothetical protein